MKHWEEFFAEQVTDKQMFYIHQLCAFWSSVGECETNRGKSSILEQRKCLDITIEKKYSHVL